MRHHPIHGHKERMVFSIIRYHSRHLHLCRITAFIYDASAIADALLIRVVKSR